MSLRFRRVLHLVASALVAAGCSGPTDDSGSGTPSTLTVRVYQDLDYAGEYTSNDWVTNGVRVRLTPADGAAPMEAVTADSGVAVFPGLRRGTYTVEVVDVPTSLAVQWGPPVTLVVPRQGGELTANLRLAYAPASLSGSVFRDDDLDRTRDPGEPPVVGARVRLLGRSASVVAEAFTDAVGGYAFPSVRLRPDEIGRAWASLEVTPPATGIAYIEPRERLSFLLDPGETKRLDVRYFVGVPESIAAAKRRPLGSVVTVQGVTTTAEWALSGGGIYLQDETGGIQIHTRGPGHFGYPEGTTLRVSGRLESVKGELSLPVILHQSADRHYTTQPWVVTGAEVAARTHEGVLALVRGVRVTAIGESRTGSTFNNYDVSVVAPDGTAFVVRMEFGIRPHGLEVPRERWVVDSTFDVTGVLSSVSGVPYLRPRGYWDVVPL